MLDHWRLTRRRLSAALGALSAIGGLGLLTGARPARASLAPRTPILVYTAVEPEWLPVYKEAFEAVHPDYEVRWVRASAGPIAARLTAERARPQADVVFGLSAIAMEGLRRKGLLTPWRPAGAERLDPRMRAEDFSWFGMNAWGGSVCVNTELLARFGLSRPESWEDLARPEFRRRIVMPSPLASSTGYMFFIGWLQGFGDARGWDYFRRLSRNMLFYASSGARPAAMTAQGEITVGLSSAAFVKPFERHNIPVVTVEPREGVAWDAEACALPAGSPHPEAARVFLDFCASEAVAKIAARFSGIAAIPEFSTPEGRRISSRFLPLDFARAGAEKSAVVRRWQEEVRR